MMGLLIYKWAPLTRSRCKVSDTQVTGKACGPLMGWRESNFVQIKGYAMLKEIIANTCSIQGIGNFLKSYLHNHKWQKSFFFPFFWYLKRDSSWRIFHDVHALVDNFNLYISVHCWFISLSFLHRRTNLTRSLFHSAPVTSQDCDADPHGVASCSITGSPSTKILITP